MSSNRCSKLLIQNLNQERPTQYTKKGKKPGLEVLIQVKTFLEKQLAP